MAASSRPTGAPKLTTIAALFVLLHSAEGPGTDTYGDDENRHARFSHAVVVCPPGPESRGQALEEQHEHQGASEAGSKAVGTWPQGGQVEEARSRGVRGDNEDVVLARWQVPICRLGILPVGRGRRRLIHGSGAACLASLIRATYATGADEAPCNTCCIERSDVVAGGRVS